MYEKPRKTLQTARNLRGMTQEQVAEATDYSVDSIRAWESGSRPMTIPALMKFAEVLDAPGLELLYLREQYGDGFLRGLVPEFEQGRTLSGAAAAFVSCILELTDEKFDRKLLRMVADETIDASEQPIYGSIIESSEEAFGAYLTLRCAKTTGGG